MRAWPAAAWLAAGALLPLLAAGRLPDEAPDEEAVRAPLGAPLGVPADVTADAPDDGAAAFRLGFLVTHCVPCHGPEEQRGDFRLDTAPFDLRAGAGRDTWQRVLDYVDHEDMPPPDAPGHPTRVERDRFVALLRDELEAAEARAGAGGLRRLGRDELLNSVRDLFGVRGIRLPNAFPEDLPGPSAGTALADLTLSAAHVHATLELAADVAGRMVFVPGPQVTSVSDITAWSQEGSWWAKDGDATSTAFSGVNNAAWCGAVWDRAFVAPASGRYEVRVRVRAEGDTGADGRPLRLGFYALLPGDFYMPESANRIELPRVGELDVPASSELRELTCLVELEQGESFHVYCENRLPATAPQGALNRVELAHLFMAAEADRTPTVRIDRMTVTGPVAPLSRQVDFLGGRARPTADEAFLRSVLLPLAERAYRRPPTEAEVEDLIGPVMGHLDEVGSPELALRFGIRRILLSPAFHYLDGPRGGRDAHALASRLAAFLWSSIPDRELRDLAATGRIAEPDVLRQQVLRLLADPKGQRFVRDVTGRWLGGHELETLMVCDQRHVWNEPLRHGYIRSTELFFDEVLRRNHSIRTFLDSDFTYANLPMRMVWGLPGDHPPMSLIESNQAQSHIWPEPERLDLTALGPDAPAHVARRGGVLGLPGVLTLTGDGVESSPIRRGVWVLENLYGTPPPPPPDDVRPLVTDTTGATTVRETMAAHQDSPSCASCHARIDPVGLALENYDAAGNWRDAYDLGMPGEGALTSQPVDSTGVLPDGSSLAGPTDLKRHLLEHAEMFTAALATRLLEHATGRRASAADARVIQEIVRAEPPGGWGLRDLLVTLVQSEAFRR